MRTLGISALFVISVFGETRGFLQKMTRDAAHFGDVSRQIWICRGSVTRKSRARIC